MRIWGISKGPSNSGTPRCTENNRPYGFPRVQKVPILRPRRWKHSYAPWDASKTFQIRNFPDDRHWFLIWYLDSTAKNYGGRWYLSWLLSVAYSDEGTKRMRSLEICIYPVASRRKPYLYTKFLARACRVVPLQDDVGRVELRTSQFK